VVKKGRRGALVSGLDTGTAEVITEAVRSGKGVVRCSVLLYERIHH
jgi:hypothetical protein